MFFVIKIVIIHNFSHIQQESIEGAVGGLSANDIDDATASKFSPSPKRFAKQDLVYLADIDTIEELSELSGTQLKKLLAMNRVTFKGVVEKDELLKIVTRLWKQEQKAEEGNYFFSSRYTHDMYISFSVISTNIHF